LMTDPCPSPSRGRQVPAREVLVPGDFVLASTRQRLSVLMAGAAPLGDLLRAAPVQASGCEGGYVDAPGSAPH
jgi:hypothetical protein